MKISKTRLQQIIKEEVEHLRGHTSLQESLFPLGFEGYDVVRQVLQGGLDVPGGDIAKITPESARGLRRHWEPYPGYRFRYLDPQDIQDKIPAIEKKMQDYMFQFVSAEVAEKTKRGIKQADASDGGSGMAKVDYWMNFLDAVGRPTDPKANKELIGKFVDDPRKGQSNDYIVMAAYQGPEGTELADDIFVIYKTLGKIYFVDADKGFIKEDPHYYVSAFSG